jgi:uncharacterized surface protein with fasciclin (FAS1) repeats
MHSITRTFSAVFLASAVAACSTSNKAAEPEVVASSESAGAEAAAPQPTDIVDTAAAAGNFQTLLAAMQAAGMIDTLKGNGPFTVFAPTDEAFKDLPPEIVNGLLTREENREKLTQLLKNHVVAGEVHAADVAQLTSATTVQGGTLPISASGEGVTVGEAHVVKTDIECSNGVIHVIDKVLIPKS